MLNFTNDIIVPLYSSKVAADSNYQSPGLWGLGSSALSGPLQQVYVTAPGTGFTSLPSVAVTDVGGGTGASVTALLGAISGTVVAAGTGFVPGDLITLPVTGGTLATVLTVATTKVVSASVTASPGTGGTTGTQTVSGTTGLGATKFSASVTVTAGAITAVLSITVAGSYTQNPTNILNEPVTGGGLTGATLAVVLGVNTVTVATAGNYTTAPSGTLAQASTTSVAGVGSTFTTVNGVSGLILAAQGDGYVTPVLAISGGGGSAATASADSGGAGLLMLIEIIRAYVSTLSTSKEIHVTHRVLEKMLQALKSGSAPNFSTLSGLVQQGGLQFLAGYINRTGAF